jgi:hypothetical protein
MHCLAQKELPIDAENKQLSLNAEQDNKLSMRLAKKMLKKRLTALMAKLKPWLMEINIKSGTG